MTRTPVSVAGAPVSFGVFEMTPVGSETVSSDSMLTALADAGYEGIDLGPVGYLGEGAALTDALERRGLALAGGWVQLPFTEDAFEASVGELDRALEVFAAAPDQGEERPPLPTLADSGSALRRAAPGSGRAVDPLSDALWSRLVDNVGRAADRVRAAGFEPTFHHHAGTFVEDPDEVDRFLADTDVDLTLDVGHLQLAGGDARVAAERWASRINHLHLKDVDSTILRAVLDSGGGMPEVWASGAFVPLGQGDVDITGVLDVLTAAGYDGWVVVEQDVLNGPGTSIESFFEARVAEQVTSRRFLERWVR
jgi:inosose dehydratase